MSAALQRERAVAARFGIEANPRLARPTPPNLSPPRRAKITLLIGPSGSGKSTALRAIARRARSAHTVIDAARIRLRDASCIAHIPAADPDRAMRALASAGLAEARLALRSAHACSDGQRWRLRIAIALERLTEGGLLVIDEFAAALDAPTACAVSRSLRRAATARRIAVAVACTRADIIPPLGPDSIVHFDLAGGAVTRPGPARSVPVALRYEEGSAASYDALAHFHYIAPRPATIERVLCARAGAELAGVLVASRPTLNAAHRALAWGPRYASGCKRRDARRLNREVRCISRVVVDPRFRAQGVARRLVSRYVADPLTPRTEAVAAMGDICPFFERAGMTPYTLTPPARSARLIDALEHAGLSREALTDARCVAHALRSPRRRAFLERELRTWAASSRSTSRSAQRDVNALIRLARTRLFESRTAYAHTA